MANNKRVGKITIEGARIGFKNFKGLASTYNRAGNRTFTVFVDPDFGAKLAEDGWNCKPMKQRDEYEEPDWKLEVTVMFGNYPPNINLVKGKKIISLMDDEVNILDSAEISNWDLVIRPYSWELPSGASGIKAYADVIYATMVENAFGSKYDFDVEDMDAPF